MSAASSIDPTEEETASVASSSVTSAYNNNNNNNNNDNASSSASSSPARPQSAIAIGGDPGDELARLKRQVAALKVSTPAHMMHHVPNKDNTDPIKKKKKNKKKNDALFGYWKETSTTEGRAEPPPIKVPPLNNNGAKQQQQQAAAEKKKKEEEERKKKKKSNTTLAVIPPYKPPPSAADKNGIDDNDDGDDDDDGRGDDADENVSVASSSVVADSVSAGSKWNPEEDIRRGSVAKFASMFGTSDGESRNGTGAQTTPAGGGSPPRAVRRWRPPPPPPPPPPTSSSTTGGPTGGAGAVRSSSPAASSRRSSSPGSSSKGWAPREEIDSNRMGSIMSMWGATTTMRGGATAAVVGGGDEANNDGAQGASSSSSSGIPPPPFRRGSGRSAPAAPAPTAKEEEDSAGVVPALPFRRDAGESAEASHFQISKTETSQFEISKKESEFSTSTETGMTTEDTAEPRDGASYDDDVDNNNDHDNDNDDDDNDGAEDSSTAPSLESKLDLWEEILSLVHEVLPDEVDNADDLLAQFNGRETALRDALRGMRERSVGDNNPISSSGKEKDDDESLTTVDDDDELRDGDAAEVSFECEDGRNSGIPYADVGRMVAENSTAGEGKEDRGTGARRTMMSSSSAGSAAAFSPDDFVPDDEGVLPAANVDGEGTTSEGTTSEGTDPRKEEEEGMDDGFAAGSSFNTALTAATPVASNRGADDGSSRGDNATLESEGSRHVSFVESKKGQRGRRRSGREATATKPPGGETDCASTLDASQTSKDKFTGQSYYYSNGGSNRSVGEAERGRAARRSSASSSAGGPAAAAAAATRLQASDDDDDEEGSFETFHIGSVAAPSQPCRSQSGLVPSAFVAPPGARAPPSAVGGRAASVVSELPAPPAGPPPGARDAPLWRRKRRVGVLACAAVVLLAACGAGLGLFLSGVLGGGDEEGERASAVINGPAPPTTPPPTPTNDLMAAAAMFPTPGPSSSPLSSPSGSPVSSCSESVRLNAKTLGLANDPGKEAPNVAVDGRHAVVATNAGGVRFYSLDDDADDGDGGGWTQVDYFPNINRHPSTPAVAMSGDVAVVGFVYQVLGFNRGTGGAYVYERDEGTGRWKKTDELLPDDGVEASARFGSSVDVDAGKSGALIAVGAHGENDKAGSVYVFKRTRIYDRTEWSRAGKVLPEFCPEGDFEFNFGYSVAVSGNVVAASTDCDFIVQLSSYDPASDSMRSFQNLRYIDFTLGAISSLVMDGRRLAYSTYFGGVVIYGSDDDGSGGDEPYEFLEQLDFSDEEAKRFPLAIDGDLLAVGVGNGYWIFPEEEGGAYEEGAFVIRNGDAADAYETPSLGVSGRTVLAGIGDPHEVYHYDVSDCAQDAPTSSPTVSSAPIPYSTWPPSLKPTTGTPTAAPTASEAPTVVTPVPTTASSSGPSASWRPTASPSARATAPPTRGPIVSSASPSLRPTRDPTPLPTPGPTPGPVISSASPSLRPTRDPTPLPSSPPSPMPIERTAAPSDPPATSSASSCYPVEIDILYDGQPFGVGYTLTKIEPTGTLTTVVSYWVPFEAEELANTRVVEPFCLEKGSYQFTMYDSYSDGLCCVNGEGEYIVSKSDDGAILARGGKFGLKEETTFALPIP